VGRYNWGSGGLRGRSDGGGVTGDGGRPKSVDTIQLADPSAGRHVLVLCAYRIAKVPVRLRK